MGNTIAYEKIYDEIKAEINPSKIKQIFEIYGPLFFNKFFTNVVVYCMQKKAEEDYDCLMEGEN